MCMRKLNSQSSGEGFPAFAVLIQNCNLQAASCRPGAAAARARPERLEHGAAVGAGQLPGPGQGV